LATVSLKLYCVREERGEKCRDEEREKKRREAG
jgi:hypothetical protein